MIAVYMDDFGTMSIKDMTKEEMERKNRFLEEQSLEEYGFWVDLESIPAERFFEMAVLGF